MPRQSRTAFAVGLAAAAIVSAEQATAQYVIFAPDTDPAYKQQVLEAVAQRQARLRSSERYSPGTRWAAGSVQGDPIGITWSIVPDGIGPIPKNPENFFEDPGISQTFQTFDQKFNGRETWLAIIRDAFQRVPAADATPGSINAWGNISGINFSQVTAPAVPDPDNPGQFITFDWDTGATWDGTGSVNGFLSPPGGGGVAPADPQDPGVGDIRIAAKRIDNFGGVLAYAYPPNDPLFPGEIVLDIAEEWDRPPVNFRFMRNIISQMVGFAIGLELACPEIGERVMEPLQDFGFTGPQLDDIRGVQFLYGDYLEINDARDTIEGVDIGVSLADSLLGQVVLYDRLSLDVATDEDVFVLNFPDVGSTECEFDVVVTASPIGETYEDGPAISGNCGGQNFDQINALAIRDLRIALLDSDLMNVDGFECDVAEGQPLPTDGSGFVNEGTIGEPECVRLTVTQPGTYFVVIGGGTGGGDANESQLYSLEFAIGNQIFNDGISFDTVCLALAPNGLGANRINDIQPTLPGVPAGETAYRGRSARVGNVEDRHPSLGHATTEFLSDPPPLIGQDFPPQRIAWPGNALAPAALGGVSSHATSAVACAIGNPVGVFGGGFIGPAPEASWLSASVGIRSFGDAAFTTSREAILYGLFGLANPDTALALGLPTTATVLNNSWGAGGDTRGDSTVSHIYDAVVYMTGVPAVVAAGNEGAIDNTPLCGGLGGSTPGALFRGSRTVTFPATAFNTFSVGMAGKEIPDETPPTPEFVTPQSQPYTHVEDNSSKGPIDSFNFESGSTSFEARPGIDVLSIGTGYLLVGTNPQEQDPPGDPCSYRGHPTAILLSLPFIPNNSPDPDNPNDPDRFQAGFGTSFAAPAIAGAIALLQDYAASQNPPFELDPVVLRALLLTGARKLDGWSNNGNPARPQDNRDGRNPEDNPDTVVRTTDQALDYAQGAGFADLKRSFEILRGEYDLPELSGIVFGAPSTDFAITPPDVPVINTPPNEQELIRPIPISNEGPASVDELPPSPLEIADMLRRAREGVPDDPVFRIQGDFQDPDIGQVGGVKSAAGTTFDARVPFKLPPNPNRPGGVEEEPPIEIAPQFRIVANPIGWDHAKLGQRLLNMPAQGTGFQGGAIRAGYIDYFIAYAFDGNGDVLTATLCWNREVEMDVPDFTDIDNPLLGEVERLELENLELELIQTDAVGNIFNDHIILGTIGEDPEGVVWASSLSSLSNIEHIHTKTPGIADDEDDEIIPSGFYTLRVRWTGTEGFTGQEYDLFDNSPRGEVEYGLAWRVEPTEGSDPGGDDEETLVVSASSAAPTSQPMRVLNMFLDSFGSNEGDDRYSRAFDINRDGSVDVQDFGPIYRFWFLRD